MNHTELRDFPSKTLNLVSSLIDKRTATIRNQGFMTIETIEELDSLLEFQTQVLYASMIVSKEEKVSQS